MSATTNLKKLIDGDKRQVVQIQILSDGSELTDSVVYDYSGETLLPGGSGATSAKIMQAWFENPTAAGQFFVEFDGATDRLACGCGIGDSHYADYRAIGGLQNNAATPTGDITLTTLGLANDDQAIIVLDIAKS